MKQIIINEKCNGCGMCIVKCPNYFEENDDGNAQVIKGVLAGNDAVLDTVISECPVKAISLGESVDKKQSIQEELNKLKVFANGMTVKRDDIAFTDAYCTVTTFPYVGSSSYEYSSSSSAERAGLSKFRDRAYSQIDSKILDVITTYRVNIIKPYYSTDERSVYTQFNKKVSDVLTAIANLVGKGKLPSDFCNVDIYPDTDTVWKMLEKGEIIGENFVSIVRREFKYSASEYQTYIDWDDMEDYRGRDKYCYRAQEAVEELRKDVQNAVRWARSDIEDGALGYVNGIVNNYNQKLKTCLEKKLSVINQAISRLTSYSSSSNSSSAKPTVKYNAINEKPIADYGTVKLKPSAKKYCSTNYSLFTTPPRYFDMEWKLIEKCNYVSLYNMKLMSEGIIILVQEDDIVKI